MEDQAALKLEEPELLPTVEISIGGNVLVVYVAASDNTSAPTTNMSASTNAATAIDAEKENPDPFQFMLPPPPPKANKKKVHGDAIDNDNDNDNNDCDGDCSTIPSLDDSSASTTLDDDSTDLELSPWRNEMEQDCSTYSYNTYSFETFEQDVLALSDKIIIDDHYSWFDKLLGCIICRNDWWNDPTLSWIPFQNSSVCSCTQGGTTVSSRSRAMSWDQATNNGTDGPNDKPVETISQQDEEPLPMVRIVLSQLPNREEGSDKTTKNSSTSQDEPEKEKPAPSIARFIATQDEPEKEKPAPASAKISLKHNQQKPNPELGERLARLETFMRSSTFGRREKPDGESDKDLTRTDGADTSSTSKIDGSGDNPEGVPGYISRTLSDDKSKEYGLRRLLTNRKNSKDQSKLQLLYVVEEIVAPKKVQSEANSAPTKLLPNKWERKSSKRWNGRAPKLLRVEESVLVGSKDDQMPNRITT